MRPFVQPAETDSKTTTSAPASRKAAAAAATTALAKIPGNHPHDQPSAKHSAEKGHRYICRRCGSRELRPQPFRLLYRSISVHPYLCLQCSTRQLRFHFNFLSIVTLLILGGLLSGAVYLYKNPLSLRRGGETEQSTTEALARARARTGGLSAFEEMMIKRPHTTMDNAAILKLWKANVGSEVLIKLIQTSVPDYDLSANAVIELREEGVDQTVILAMIDATYTPR